MAALDLWNALLCGLLVASLAVWLAAGWRERFRSWGWWRPLAFLAGIAVGIGTVVSPLDSFGRDGLLTAHLAQHIALGDLTAPLLLLGLPPRARRRLRRWWARLARRPGAWARALTMALSPPGALLIWAVATYVWFVPALHLAAVPGGAIHLLDHLSFFAFGFVIWFGAFDPRRTQELRVGLRLGGLPWWGRHIYAMTSRLALLPPAVVVWIASPGSYQDLARPWPFQLTRSDDQELGASMMIGFEMILFSVAIVLGFIFFIVAEGRRREAEGFY